MKYGKVKTLKEILSMDDIYIGSVNGEDIADSLNIIDVSKDSIHFSGIKEVVEFTLCETDITYKFTFDTSQFVYIYPNFDKKDKHLYVVEDISGCKYPIELLIAKNIY